MAGQFTVEMLRKVTDLARSHEKPVCAVYYPNRPGWPPDGEWYWRYADGREIPAK